MLLITLDTTRADRLSPYGDKRARTPALASLAREGVVFESAYCDVTYTTPSMASTLTGTYAYQHGLRFWNDALPDSARTIAENLQEVGFSTAAIIGSFPLKAKFQLDQGFESYDDAWLRDPNRKRGLSYRENEEVSDLAIAQLRDFEQGGAPFFLWVHYFGPHRDSQTAKDAAQSQKQHVRRYASKLKQTDAAVSRVLAELRRSGLEESTLVIVHADHGEALGEHRYIGHGRHVYEPILRVPLIMRWPGKFPAGLRIDALVGNVDIAPTILQAAGLPPTAYAEMDGRSLIPLILEGTEVRDSLYFETYMPANHGFAEQVRRNKRGKATRVGVRRAGILRPPWKLVDHRWHPLVGAPNKPIAPGLIAEVEHEDLYHLKRDPKEKRPQPAGADAALQREALRALLQKHTANEVAPPTVRSELSGQDVERLQSLGYLQ